MAIFSTIAAVVSIGSAIAGAGASASANSRARGAARTQANLTFEQRQEEIRRARLEQAQTIGYNRAAIGASNILFSGSSQRVLQNMQSEFARDIAWRNRSAELERNSIIKGGPGAGANWAAAASALGSVGSTLMQMDRTG